MLRVYSTATFSLRMSKSANLAQNSGTNSKPTFRVGGVPEHFNLPWHLALESGDFETAEVTVKYSDFPGGTGAMTRALADGEIDVAILLSEGAIADILNGGENRIVKVYVQSPLIWGIHVAAKSQFQTIDEIKNRKYAISRFGSGSHLMAIVDADERDWETEEMQFVKVGGLEGARKALPNGEADAFLWELFTTQPYVDNGEFRRIGERRVPWPAFVVSVRQECLAKNSDSIKKLLEVVDTHSKKLMAATNAVDIIAERYKLKKEDTQRWFELTKWQYGFSLPQQKFEKVIRSLEKLDLVKQRGASVADVSASL